MIRKIIGRFFYGGVVIFFSLILFAYQVEASSGNVKFIIEKNFYYKSGQKVVMDATPFVYKDRTFIPLRYVAEALGITSENILWNNKDKIVTVINGDKVVDFKVAYSWILINGKTQLIDVAPLMKNDRVY